MWITPRRRLHNLSGKTVPINKWFLMFRENNSCFNLCLLPLVLAQDIIEQALSPSHPPFRSLWILMRFPRASFSPGWAAPDPSVFPHRSCSSPFVTLMVLCWTVPSMSRSLLYWGAHKWIQFSRCSLTSAEQRWWHSFGLLAILLVMHPRISLVFFVARTLCSPMLTWH